MKKFLIVVLGLFSINISIAKNISPSESQVKNLFDQFFNEYDKGEDDLNYRMQTDQFFTSSLKRSQELCDFEADPFIEAQDWYRLKYQIQKLTKNQVTLKINNGGHEIVKTFLLDCDSDKCLIDDMLDDKGTSFKEAEFARAKDPDACQIYDY